MTRLITLATLVGGCVGVAGCGPSTATVSGTVTHKGKPVVWGGVALVAADGSAHVGDIGRDGRFRITGVPTGPAKVGVTSTDPYPDGRKAKYDGRYKPPTDLPDGAWFPLPDRFADPEKSGVTVNVGGQSTDIDLK